MSSTAPDTSTPPDLLRRLLSVTHTVGLLLDGEAPPELAVGRALQAIGSGLEVAAGVYWHREDDTLCCVDTWKAPTLDAPSWQPAAPGEVRSGAWLAPALASGQPVWTNGANDGATDATGNGSTGAPAGIGHRFALPLRGRRSVYGALEFLHDGAVEHGPALGQALEHIGDLLGRYVERDELANAERSLRARLDALVDHAPVGMCFLDLEARYLLVNRGLAEINGLPAEAHIGRTVAEVLPDAWQDFSAHFEAARAGEGRTFLLSGETPAQPGVVRHWLETVYPIGRAQDPSGVGVVVVDVTEQQRAQEELARSRATLDGFAAHAPVAVSILDAEGRYLMTNPVVGMRAGGYEPAEMIGRPVAEFFPANWERLGPLHERALRDGEVARAEVQTVDEHGDIRTMLSTAFPIRSGDGAIWAVGLTSIDISERAAAEERLRVAAEVQGDFLGMVAHELRTPLTSIVGFTRILQRRGDSIGAEERRDLTDTLATEVERLRGIVANMLTLARIDSELPELEPVLLSALVRDRVEEAQGVIQAPIKVHADDDVVANGVEEWLEQIVGNLLSNAYKYAGAGVPIEVRVERADREAIVRVLDRGPGISDSQMDRIFEPFFRGEKPDSTIAGIGLGLTVCRRLTELQQGRIWLRPREGGGAEAGFALPLVALDED